MTGPVAMIRVSNDGDRLGQARWSTFLAFIRASVASAARSVGGEPFPETYTLPNAGQEAATFALRLPDDPGAVDRLKGDLAELCRTFEQDSIVWIGPATVEHLRPPKPRNR